MKKIMFYLFISFFFVFLGLHCAFGQWGYQQFYYPWGYQQPYYPWGYQQLYDPWGYQQLYDPWGYQQSYDPWGYQQFYNPWGYLQSYYPWGYQQLYDPWSYQQLYDPWGQQQTLNPWASSFSYFSPWSYSWGNTSVDVCGIPGTGLYGKPAIYLYPREDTYINVELDIDGQLTQAIPFYDEGWYVLGTPNGDIFDMRDGYNQDPYDYLFWEAETDLSKLELTDQGWVMARGFLETWFSENLPLLGLNEKEMRQFMEYWLERLSTHPFYEIKLLSSKFLTEHATLTITPQPDTLIRVIFFFRPLDEPIDEANAPEPPVVNTPNREGFVVLEWGGILGY